MLGNTKSLKRNNRKCKGILIVPSMAPRFEVQDSAVVYPTHSPNRAVGFRPKFRGADGKPTTEPSQVNESRSEHLETAYIQCNYIVYILYSYTTFHRIVRRA